MQRSEASTTARGVDLVIVRGRTIWCRSGDETEENRGPFGRSRRRAELSREHSFSPTRGSILLQLWF